MNGSAAFNQGPSPDAPFACLDGEGGVCGECEDCNPSAATALDLAKLRLRLEVEAAREQTYPVCLTSKECLALVRVVEQAKLVSDVARHSVVSGDVSVALTGLREALNGF